MNIQEMTGAGVTWRIFFISATSLLGFVMLACAWLWRDSRTPRFFGWVCEILDRDALRYRMSNGTG